MSNKKHRHQAQLEKKSVTSLLDHMVDGREYQSLTDLAPTGMNLRDELRRALVDIEQARGRPAIVYAANVINQRAGGSTGIDLADDLPFAEMVDSIPDTTSTVDIFLVTPGGSGQQVSQFVQRLRPRFSNVGFVLPYMCMSAGTIWALSGDEIWMDERAFLGPIDPQVPGRDGRLIPAQALITMLNEIQARGEENMKKGQNPLWSHVQILRGIDAKEIGNTLSQSAYAIQLASEYLRLYKFRDWTAHRSGAPVTDQDRTERAREVAGRLCSHDYWKTHSSGISREIARDQLRIKIDYPEAVDGLQRAIRRCWAVLYWAFEVLPISKIYLTQGASLFRTIPEVKQ